MEKQDVELFDEPEDILLRKRPLYPEVVHWPRRLAADDGNTQQIKIALRLQLPQELSEPFIFELIAIS